MAIVIRFRLWRTWNLRDQRLYFGQGLEKRITTTVSDGAGCLGGWSEAAVVDLC